MLYQTFFLSRTLIFLAFSLFTPSLFAKTTPISDSLITDSLYLLFFLIALSLLPFIAIMVSSFTKIIVVLSIARQALGTAQAPPNIVIISLSLILTLFSMYPTITKIQEELKGETLQTLASGKSFELIIEKSKEPLKEFMAARVQEKDQDLFLGILEKNTSATHYDRRDFIILAPAFLISELSHAFQIGFLIYLPFLVIDMTIANLLMALGMQMLSPTTISLPFKILLFVLVDGWRMLAEALIKV